MSAPVPLRILPEAEALAPVGLAALHAEAARPGVRALLERAPPYDLGQVLARLEERSAGPVRPGEASPWMARPVEVCRVADVLHPPRYGALIWADGTAPRAPLGGPLEDLEKLSQAPMLSRLGEGLGFTPPGDDVPELAAASVFLPWGGGFNYGHLITDALASLLGLEEAGLLGELPPIAPPLKRWQRQLIALLLGREDGVREIEAPVVRLRQAAYATSMDHYLHAPTPLLLRVRDRLLSRAGPPPLRAERVYLSRRSHAHPMRICLNEAELERALARRGFTIVRPERLSPSEQIALCRQARVIVGPSGAAMVNALFAGAGATVVDIQPQLFPSAWVPAFGELAGHDWRVFHVPAPAPLADVPWVRHARRGFRFAFHVPLDSFLPFLDALLG